jgi:hypothetical protein
MNTLDFITLAADINTLRRNQAAQELERFHAKRKLAFAEFDVLEGVDLASLGKNEEARKLEKMRLLREDDEWARRDYELAEAERKLITINMELDCLYNTRRAQEWYVKAVAVGVGDTELDPPPSDGEGNDIGFNLVLPN